MRKTIITIALFASLLALTACGNAKNNNSTAETLASDTVAESSTEDTTAETADTSESDTTEASTSAETSTAETASAKAAETTNASEAASEKKADFASIAGEWFIDGDTTLAFIHIGSDGTYKAFYPTGVLESEGTIRYESEVIGGTKIYWYNLYNKTGDFFTGFVDDGSKSKTDIYMGNGGEPHYVKFGVGGAADDGRGPGEEFVGTWGCGRATLKITQLSDTEFQASISWASSAAAHTEWEYPLTYKDGKLVCSGKGTKTNFEYQSENAEPDKTVDYTDGSAEFSMEGSHIVWNDLNENSGEDMMFSNTQPE